MERLRIGTRGSGLALWQAHATRDALVATGIDEADIEIVVIKTSGDRIQNRALLEAGGKGLFTKEIEEALIDKSIDIAVHSAKDMPTRLPEGLTLAAYLPRADVRDAVISHHGGGLENLPEGARFGTASLRREALLRRARPDLEITLLRGNLPTRIQKVEDGELDATLLAYAGMCRLGVDSHATALLDPLEFPPACGQGAVVIECREDDAAMRDLLTKIGHAETASAVTCERAFLDTLDGSCRTPIAGWAQVNGDKLSFRGLLLSPDGTEVLEGSAEGSATDAEKIGRETGAEVRGRASAELLAKIGIA
ncbi:hydroxymethylbilane synthase [Rhodopseudomonas julia]|uniref:Porphobilinogen deaminase n=1 Tax=Rhodopseudomonas julia TaxID=200617 RepID=A0ABU0C6G0_9BRAD|nr:hydroxymethylbilane synthase [Rhodopseudomonas julia]MDQ0325539.1 hydroxymethylbilane synthase [Rhodopseudomonas julia]